MNSCTSPPTPHAHTPPTIVDFCSVPLVLYDAHHATTDPARRRLDERAQLAGRHIEPVVEVEYVSSALVLVSEGFGGSVMCRAATLSAAMPANLRTVPFAEPLYDTLALVRLRGQVLPPPRPGNWPAWLGTRSSSTRPVRTARSRSLPPPSS
ncbi:LysR substrate-binding domain-containing protein [Streptomyces turgidiscabies]